MPLSPRVLASVGATALCLIGAAALPAAAHAATTSGAATSQTSGSLTGAVILDRGAGDYLAIDSKLAPLGSGSLTHAQALAAGSEYTLPAISKTGPVVNADDLCLTNLSSGFGFRPCAPGNDLQSFQTTRTASGDLRIGIPNLPVYVGYNVATQTFQLSNDSQAGRLTDLADVFSAGDSGSVDPIDSGSASQLADTVQATGAGQYFIAGTVKTGSTVTVEIDGQRVATGNVFTGQGATAPYVAIVPAGHTGASAVVKATDRSGNTVSVTVTLR